MRTLYFLLLIFCIGTTSAQRKSDEKKLNILGQVLDYVTHVDITEATAVLMLEDSTVVDSCKKNIYGSDGLQNMYSFSNVAAGEYILKIEKAGYETYCERLVVDKVHRSERYRILPEVYLKRPKVHTINEVVVTATKVKFYHKGDTLIYNADAFQLSEGSMLDALIRQLPGAELKSDGRIYVNGRFVESLMLNGKDFFKGNNNIMLQNLPTYAVSTVKVYDKAGEMSDFMGRDMNDKSFVMDVCLKKQYNIGWMGNIDAGTANDRLYMARMFAMRFTDHSQLAVFGNINNINDHTTPSNYSDWTPDKMPYGRLNAKMAGVTLNIDDRHKRYTYYGQVGVTHYDNHQTEDVFRQNFLSTGDTYDREKSNNRFCNFFLNTHHDLRLMPGRGKNKIRINITPSASYQHNKSNLSAISATSKEVLDNVGDFTQLLSSPLLSDELRSKLINRHLSASVNDRKSWNANLSSTAYIKTRYNNDMLMLSMNGCVQGSDYGLFSRNRVDYYAQKPQSTDFRNRYTDYIPSRGYSYTLGATYNFHFSDVSSLTFYYTFDKKYTSSTSRLYCLEQLDGWGADTDKQLGMLPSVADYLATLDRRNSYNSRLHDNKHGIQTYLYIRIYENEKSSMNITPGLTLDMINNRMRYLRAETDTAFHRNNVFLKPNLTVKWMTRELKHYVEFNYNMDYESPDMLYSIGFVDDTDPMSTTTYGNRHLENAQIHKFDLSYKYRGQSLRISPYAKLNLSRNNVAMGYIYDQTTGRREYSVFNVDGNWDLRTGVSASGTVGKKKLLDFSSNTSWNYINNVDMIGTSTTAMPQESTVRTSVLSENLALNYKLGKHTVGLKGSAAWMHTTSDRDGFATIDACNYNYGALASVSLPWKLQFDTDFTVYSRRGYEDASMNDNNLVWNARLTRPVLNGRLVLKLDAFDILHQLKKVDRVINAQGRTERFYNTLPRYLLVHAVYKFNIIPKNKM